jgi:hypothetical protein
MSDEIKSTDTLLEINSQANVHHHHSPTKTFQVKIENGHDILDEQSSISSPSHIDHGVDSGLSSEITNIEIEKTTGDDELSSTSGTSSIKHQRELSPTSGVIIPEEKRVTDRVKVFEAVANNNEKLITKNGNNNNNKKKSSLISSSFSIGDHKQISPPSTETFDTQSINEIKPSKNKSKKNSLKKQIQNLLKIDKPSIQDEKKDHSKKKYRFVSFLLLCVYLDSTTSTLKQINPIEPLEIHIPSSSSSTVSKLVHSFQMNDIESPMKTPVQSENVSYFRDKKLYAVHLFFIHINLI